MKSFLVLFFAIFPLFYCFSSLAADSAESCAQLFQRVPELSMMSGSQSGEVVRDDAPITAEYRELLGRVQNLRERFKPETLPTRREIMEILAWVDARRKRLEPYSFQRLFGACLENFDRRSRRTKEQMSLSILQNLPVHNPHEHLSGSLPSEVLFRIVSRALERSSLEGRKDRLSQDRFIRDSSCDESCRKNFFRFEEKFRWGTKELRDQLNGDPLYWLEILREKAKGAAKEGVLTLKWTPLPARASALEKALLALSPAEKERINFHVGLGREQPNFDFRQLEEIVAGHPEIARRTTGIDLWGEEKGDFLKMIGQEIEARASSLRLGERLGRRIQFIPHAGEAGDPRMVWTAVLLGAGRIGHGHGAVKDPILMMVLRDLKIPIEVCLSSNEMLYPSSYPGFHPLQIWVLAGVKVFLATDNGGIFRTDIEKEYSHANRRYGIPLCELARIRYDGLVDPATPGNQTLSALLIKQVMKRKGCPGP